MKKAVIIAAGGKGIRMNSNIPKQFNLLQQKPILFYTIEAFFKYSKEVYIVLALPKNHISNWLKLTKEHSFNIPHCIVEGGDTRYNSVKNALEKITNYDIIAVHDAVRPFITNEFLQKLYSTAEEKGTAIPVIQVNETVREITNSQNKVLNREHIFLIQTPQVFNKDWLLKAYELPYSQEITDDAMLVEKAGYNLTFVEGLKYNIKITTPDDLFFANYLKTKLF